MAEIDSSSDEDWLRPSRRVPRWAPAPASPPVVPALAAAPDARALEAAAPDEPGLEVAAAPARAVRVARVGARSAVERS